MRADEVYAILKGKLVKLTEDIKSMGDWKPIQHKGTVQTADALPTDAKEGWMYNIATDSIYGAAGMNVVMTSEGWDPMGPIINMGPYLTKEEGNKTFQPKGNYLSGTDSDLKESGKAADAKVTGEKIAKNSSDITKKLDKNQGVENSGKIAGINESGDIVPIFPVGVDYNSETNCLEFGSDQKMELNQGIGLDSTLTKTGSAADAGATGKEIASLKEDISTKITKFYASSQGETHLADSDNGKIMDMMLYGKSEQKQYSGKNLLNATFRTTTLNGVTCTDNGDGTYTVNGTASADTFFVATKDFTFEKDKKYKIVGCPKGGGLNVYRLDGALNVNSDTGDGKEYTGDGNSRSVRIIVFQGQTANNLLFKPMLTTDLTATYDDFEPYTGGQPSPSPDYPQEIKSVVNPTVKACGKNLLKATLQTTTQNGVTCTNNGDGTYTVNGTATATVFLGIGNCLGSADKTYKLCGCPLGGSNRTYFATLNRVNIQYDVGNGTTINNLDFNSEYMIVVIKGTTVNNLLFKPMLTTDLTATYNDFEPYHEQTVTLPYTLNAIPVSSGGNVTIDGQEYVSDYFDVERGKLVRMCKEIEKVTSDLLKALSFSSSNESVKYAMCNGTLEIKESNNSANVCYALCSHFKPIGWYSGDSGTIGVNIVNGDMRFYFGKNSLITTLESAKQFFEDNEVYISGVLKVPKEIDLTDEEVQALKALATYYPTTNISINSEQLDGYTVFNYPISMENGWNYVKQQIDDTRDYIYDMDARTQDTDLQAAEAYVNSEYAVALTELEV